MKVTIDSSDPLDRALKVLGSLYGVELSVASSNGTSETSAQEETATAGEGRRRARKSASEAGSSSRRPGRRSTRKSTALDMGAVRSWARENGYEVSDRGRVPNAVVTAFQESAAAS